MSQIMGYLRILISSISNITIYQLFLSDSQLFIKTLQSMQSQLISGKNYADNSVSFTIF